MAGTFRLCVAQTTTGQVIGDLPQPSAVPSWSRVISSPGTLSSVTIPLGSQWDPTMITHLDSEHYRWTLVYAYGNAILQAGLVMKVDVDDTVSPAVVQITTMTLWDFLSTKRLVGYYGQALDNPSIDINFSSTSPAPENKNLSWGSVAARLLTIATGGAGSTGPGSSASPPSGVSLPLVLPTPLSGTATITYAGADLASVGQRLTEITQQTNGPELELSPEWTDQTQTNMQWRLRSGEPRFGQLGWPWAWDYQKACTSIKYTSDGTAMTFQDYERGQDSRASNGGALVWGSSTDVTPVYPSVGWPDLITGSTTHGSETNSAVLTSVADQLVTSNQVPVKTAAMTIRNDGKSLTGIQCSPTLDQLAIGDTGVIGIKKHPWITDGQYALRIVGIASGQDQWTSLVTVQILGTVTS